VAKDLILGVGVGFGEGKIRDFNIVGVVPTKVEDSAIQCVIGVHGEKGPLELWSAVGLDEVEHVEG
jgi:hypothetical protein